MTERNQHSQEPIAIIGIGCRFPGGVNSPESYWNLLQAGVDAVTEVPSDRWDTKTFYNPNRAKPNAAVTRWGGFLDRIDQLDAEFFGLSPRETNTLDPQQRLLLEVCWEALENGGQVPEHLEGSRTGVFMGGFTLDWKYLQLSESNADFLEAHSTTGFMMTLLANRISYVFDFQGPSVSLDTACSSSLVAVHLACQSLRDGESNLALAGGVNVMLTPSLTIGESKAGMLSPDGRSKSFDDRANGYVRAEGAGAVVLKRLSDALADGDPIYAVIAGSAVNQDGRSSGLTVPRGSAQEALLREATSRAGIVPGQIQYMEAHGTGTPVGDPIEVNALGHVLSEGRPEGETCWVGSVKTNFGHAEAAAGVAGLIKATLSLGHRQIPPHLHLQNANPNIDFAALRLRVPQTLQPWPETEGPRYAGVNSFGFGGTNAHVVLREAPSLEKGTSSVSTSTPLAPALIPLSGRTPEALLDVARSYRNALDEGGSLEAVSLADLAYSTSHRRGHHPQRMALVAESKAELLEELDAFLAGEAHARVAVGASAVQADKERRLAFVYTGMGPQWWAMGRQLYETEPVFRRTLDECDRLYRELTGWSMLEEMLKDEASSRMEETEVAQPANFFVQVGLTEWWRSMGIVPDAIVGHSAGEAAAAYAAGVMSLSEAVRVIYQRSRLQQLTTGQGKLAAVGLSEAEVRTRLVGLEDRVSFAAINSPSSVTLVGDPDALEDVVAPLREAGVFVRYLHVKVPYHSHYMNPLREELLDVLDGLELQAATTPLYSTVTGTRVDGRELDGEYWWRNVREPVYFAEAAKGMLDEGYDVFLEVGPHPVLTASIRECMVMQNRQADVLPSLRRGQDERPLLLASLGALYTLGYEPAWSELSGTGAFVRLPIYPWQREVYWHESAQSRRRRLGEPEGHPLLGRRSSAARPSWEASLDLWRLPYLADHRIHGRIVYPGAAYLEMGMAAVRTMHGVKAVGFEIADVAFEKALFLNTEVGHKLQTHLDPADGRFEVYSLGVGEEPDWARHASGVVRPLPDLAVRTVDLDAWRARCGQSIGQAECYRIFHTLGLEYGPLFQGLEHLWQGEGVALAEIRLPESVENEASDYLLHPAILDLALQMMAAVLPVEEDGRSALYMPTGIKHGVLSATPSARMWACAEIKERTDHFVRGSVSIVDESGRVVVELTDCLAKSLQDEGSQGLAKPTVYSEFVWISREHAAGEEAGQAVADGTWLLLTDEAEVGTHLIEHLTARGGRPVVVRAGSEYQRLAPEAYIVRADVADDYRALLHDVTADGQPLRGIIHLWNPHPSSENALAPQGCGSVLLLTQALADMRWKQAPRLWLVTRGAQSINGQESLEGVFQSSLWGLARTIGHQEHRELWGGIVDLDRLGQRSAVEESLDLLTDILHPDGEDQIAYRDGQRLVGRLADCGDLAAPLPPVFRADGAYLITGAFGGLGLLVARWLLAHGARRLILVGREPFPARAEWSQHGADTRIGQRIQAIRELEAQGASVHVTGFDISDEASLQDFLLQYDREGWPSICGVFHSAGTARPQILAQMTLDDLHSVMRPKVQGAWNLHRAFANRPLDCFVLFSSIAAQVTSPGQANYSAGNAFMDALARFRQAAGLPGLSINWGAWAEVGMADQLDLLDFFERRGIFPILPEQGIAALGHLLQQTKAHVTVAALDWAAVATRNYLNGEFPPMLFDIVAQAQAGQEDDGQEAVNTVDFATLYRQAADEERHSLLEERLCEVVSQILRVPRAKLLPDRSLQAYGLDSMMAIELKGSLEKTIGASLPIVELIRGVSVMELAVTLRPQVEEWAIPAERDETDELLAELGDLTPEQLEALLAEVTATKEEN